MAGNMSASMSGSAGTAMTTARSTCSITATALDFPDANFDAAISTEVLDICFNDDEIPPELFPVPRPGWKLFVTTPFLWPEHEQPYDPARDTSFGLRAPLEARIRGGRRERRGHAAGTLPDGPDLRGHRARSAPGDPGRLAALFWSRTSTLSGWRERAAARLPGYLFQHAATARKPAERRARFKERRYSPNGSSR